MELILTAWVSTADDCKIQNLGYRICGETTTNETQLIATIPRTNISAVQMLYFVKVSFESKINKQTINCLLKPLKLGGLWVSMA